MRTLSFLSVVALLLMNNASAQSFAWAKQLMGAATLDTSIVQTLTADTFGNVYIAGRFKGTVDFDPGPGVYNLGTLNPPYNNYGLFIEKLSPTGDLIWVKDIVTVAGPDRMVDIKLDPAGNIIVIGEFTGIVDFDPGPGTVYLDNNAHGHVFILKLDNNGNYIAHGQVFDFINSLAVDRTGNIIIVGLFSGIKDIDPGPGVYNGIANNIGTFVEQLSPSLSLNWVATLDNTYNNPTFGEIDFASVTTDSSGEVYVTGTILGPADFAPGSEVANGSPTNGRAIYVWKLSASGSLKWFQLFNRIGNIGGGVSYSIAANNDGVYTVGQIGELNDFDPGPGQYLLGAAGVVRSYISKLDTAGNFLWAKEFDSSTIWQVALDDSGNVCTAGTYAGATDFDPGPATSTQACCGGDILKLSSTAIFKSVYPIIKANNATRLNPYALFAGKEKNIYLGGEFTGIADFNGSAAINNMTPVGGINGFILKLGYCTQAPGIGTLTGNDTVCAYGQQTYTVPSNSPNVNSFQWTYPSGWTGLASGNNLAVAPTGSGTITVQAVNNCGLSPVRSMNIVVNPLPVITIVQNGNILSTPGNYITYQWYRNNAPMPGATNSIYNIPSVGSFYLIAMDSNGCSDTSNTLLITGISDVVNTVSPPLVYPNPSTGEVYVTHIRDIDELVVTDVVGREAYKGKPFTNKTKFSVRTRGVYLVTIYSCGEKWTEKILIE